jgi:ABC-2 type transport system ATP-binding protein
VAGFDVVLDPLEVKRRIGYVPEPGALYESLTAREYMELVASLYHQEPGSLVERVDEFLERVDLASARNQRLSD